MPCAGSFLEHSKLQHLFLFEKDACRQILDLSDQMLRILNVESISLKKQGMDTLAFFNSAWVGGGPGQEIRSHSSSRGRVRTFEVTIVGENLKRNSWLILDD